MRRDLLQAGDISLADTLRAREAAEQQAQAMEASSRPMVDNVATVAMGTTPVRGSTQTSRPAMQITCNRCGRRGHAECDSAKGKNCRQCGKTGHFARACRSGSSRDRQLNAIPDEEEGVTLLQDAAPEEQSVFHINSDPTSARVSCTIGGAAMEILIDSGAGCNIMDTETFERLPEKPPLQPASRRLFAYGSSEPLQLRGKVTLPISVFGIHCEATFYIFQGRATTVLGRQTATDMGVLRIGPPSSGPQPAMLAVDSSDDPVELLIKENRCADAELPVHLRLGNIIKDNAQVFTGIGCLNGYSATIHLTDDARPVCHPPSRVPVHLTAAVDKELQLLESLGIIEPVSGPAPWVARMKVVPKAQSGEVRITQDLRDVNKFVIRERHQIPTFEEVTGSMVGAKVFSELDVAKAFYQIPVAESCKNLLTFSTPRGHRRLTRLCMGLSTAQEILQSVMSGVLAGLDKVKRIHDDIVVFSNSLEEHNERLAACLSRLQQVPRR